jgi:hypothetical protein
MCYSSALMAAREHRGLSYGGDAEWRQQMWGAIVALHGRYPTQLEALKDKWWKDDSQTETLCALAVWRAELDDTGQIPATSSPSKTSSPTTPSSCASREAGSPRHGSPGRRPPSGPTNSTRDMRVIRRIGR